MDEGPGIEDELRKRRALELCQEGLRFLEAGSSGLARTHFQLAASFDQENRRYQDLLASVNADASRRAGEARSLSQRARQEMRLLNFSTAKDLLEDAIELSPEAVYLNELGLLVGMKLREQARAEELIERAIALAPKNTRYRQSLEKVRAQGRLSGDPRPERKTGLLSLLSRLRGRTTAPGTRAARGRRRAGKRSRPTRSSA